MDDADCVENVYIYNLFYIILFVSYHHIYLLITDD